MACETTPQLTRLACALRSVSIWKYRSEALKCENKLLKEKLQAMELRLCAQHTSSKAPLVVYVSDDELTCLPTRTITPQHLVHEAPAHVVTPPPPPQLHHHESIFDQFMVIGSELELLNDHEEEGDHPETTVNRKKIKFFSNKKAKSKPPLHLPSSPTTLLHYTCIHSSAAPIPEKITQEFAFPDGLTYKRIDPNASLSDVNTILFGPYTKRNNDSFIFTFNDETKENSPMVYGVCVMQPRLVMGGKYATKRCYCLLTRVPHFDLHFKVLFLLLSAQRIARMPVDGCPGHDSHGYDTFEFHKQVFQKYSMVNLNEIVEYQEFSVCEHLPPVAFKFPESLLLRNKESNWIESRKNSIKATSKWALPCLFSMLSLEKIIKVVSLALNEQSVIVVSAKYGVCSSAVLGLAYLLRPLFWCCPIIPILPSSMSTMLAAPCPLFVGITENALRNADVTPSPGSFIIRLDDGGSIEEVDGDGDGNENGDLDGLFRSQKLSSKMIEASKALCREGEPLYNPTLTQLKMAERLADGVKRMVVRVLEDTKTAIGNEEFKKTQLYSLHVRNSI